MTLLQLIQKFIKPNQDMVVITPEVSDLIDEQPNGQLVEISGKFRSGTFYNWWKEKEQTYYRINCDGYLISIPPKYQLDHLDNGDFVTAQGYFYNGKRLWIYPTNIRKK